MASRVRYLAKRASGIPRALMTPVGLAALAAAVLGVVALFVGEDTGRWLGALSLVLWLVTALMLADRIRIIAAKTDRQPAEPVQMPAPAPPTRSEPTALETRRLEAARTSLSHIAPAPPEDTVAPTAPLSGGAASEPKVTVVVPCFDDSRYLGSCLESVKRQTYETWECIVVDDASTDDSVRTAWNVARTDRRIRVVRHTRNRGLSAARNTGLLLAAGELVTFLDSDDLLTEDSLADRITYLAPHLDAPGVAGVFGGAILAPDDATPEDYQVGRVWSKPAIDFVTSGDHCPFNVHAAVTKTAVLRAAGGFNELMTYGAEDWDLWYRVLRNGYRFVPASLASAVYRQKPDSMRQRHAVEHFAEAERLTEASQTDAPESVVFQALIPPMLDSKGSYEISARLARRAIQSAATALVAEDEDGAIQVLATVDPVHPLVLAHHVHADVAITDGIRRYLGLTAAELEPLQAKLGPLADQARELVAEHLRVESVNVEPRRLDFDVLLLPQTSAQLVQMLDAVAGTALHVGVVDASAAAGDQGVADRLNQYRQAEFSVLSYTEAALKPVSARLAVVSYPREAAIDNLALRLAAGGVSVVSLANSLDAEVRVPEAPSSRIPDREIEATDLVATHRSSAVGRIVAPDPGSISGGNALTDGATAWTIEEYPDRAFDATDMARFAGIHTGERVVIIGNGPSLNNLDLSLLAGTHTIGVNGIFYAADRLPGPLSYYVVEDTMVVRDNLEQIKDYEAGHRFFPSIYREMIGESDNTTFFMMNRGFYAPESPAFCVPRFSTNPAQRLYAGQSVTAMNLQLAYFMGFTEVVLIGMDFSYSVPESSQIDGVLITSMEDDPNHFHPDYFGKGKVWKDPKLDRVLANYALAKQMYEADGRRIVNATPGGNLDLFDRVPFEELFSR